MARDNEAVSAAALMPNDFTVEQQFRRQRGSRYYYDCRVVRDGVSHVVSNRHGSWIVYDGDRMREPEAVFGAEMGRRCKFLLSTTCASIEEKIQKAMIAAAKAEAKKAKAG